MRLINPALLATAVIALAAMLCVSAQDSRPSFEVASVKHDTSGRDFRVDAVRVEGDRFVTTNASLLWVLQFAYLRTDGTRLRYSDIIGLPAWANNEGFDIQAKVGSNSRPVAPNQMRIMVQSLLADRYKLKAHWESREMPIYQLVIAKDKPKLKRSAEATPAMPPHVTSMPTSSGALSMNLTQTATSVSDLAILLQRYVNFPVKDRTNLAGKFDFALQFVLEPPSDAAPGDALSASDPTGPSIFTALSEQLGLKLESARGPVEVLVVESVQRPTEN